MKYFILKKTMKEKGYKMVEMNPHIKEEFGKFIEKLYKDKIYIFYTCEYLNKSTRNPPVLIPIVDIYLKKKRLVNYEFYKPLETIGPRGCSQTDKGEWSHDPSVKTMWYTYNESYFVVGMSSKKESYINMIILNQHAKLKFSKYIPKEHFTLAHIRNAKKWE